MLKNYFRLAVLNILKRKAFSTINIDGLTAGMTVCFLILNYAVFELSFDRFHRDVDTIVRLRGGARADSSAVASVGVVSGAGTGAGIALGEVSLGAARGVSNLIAVKLGTGIGAGDHL